MVMCEVYVVFGEQVSGVRIRIAPTKRRVDRVSRRCSVVVTVNQKRSTTSRSKRSKSSDYK
ncbi:hypothetical protein Bca101_021577 [Brassica carinata]